MEAAAEMKVGAQSVSESSVEARSTSLKVESEVEKSVIAAAEAAVVGNNISPQLQPI